MRCAGARTTAQHSPVIWGAILSHSPIPIPMGEGTATHALSLPLSQRTADWERESEAPLGGWRGSAIELVRLREEQMAQIDAGTAKDCKSLQLFILRASAFSPESSLRHPRSQSRMSQYVSGCLTNHFAKSATWSSDPWSIGSRRRGSAGSLPSLHLRQSAFICGFKKGDLRTNPSLPNSAAS